MEDIYNIDRFLTAQDTFSSSYNIALNEIKNGHKSSHWIWYIFPNVKGLGQSSQSNYYGISCLNEAKAYLAHPVLRERLIEISKEVLLQNEKTTVYTLMGSPVDVKKLKSCMTLFHFADPEEEVFKKVLDTYFNGYFCKKTIKILGL